MTEYIQYVGTFSTFSTFSTLVRLVHDLLLCDLGYHFSLYGSIGSIVARATSTNSLSSALSSCDTYLIKSITLDKVFKVIILIIIKDLVEIASYYFASRIIQKKFIIFIIIVLYKKKSFR